MPDSSQKNLGLHDNFGTDDELKTGALADGPTSSASRTVGGGSTGQTESAGGDFSFSLSDGFSFSLNVDHLLSQGGSVYETGFSLVQANSLADQDRAYDIKMNGDANLDASAGDASAGNDLGASGWDLKVDDDLASRPSAEASPSLASLDSDHEIVQGANLLSNVVDVNTVGGSHGPPAASDGDAD